MDPFRPRRSVLYLPAANPRAVVKARTLDCDVVILDLEDAVAPAAKETARAAAISEVAAGGWGHREVLIRVNALVTPWSEADFAAAASLAGATGFGGIVVPKVADAADAAVAVSRGSGVGVWAMIETPAAVLAAEQIAATPGVAALVAGAADLANGLRARSGGGRLPLLYSLSRIVLAARAANILAFDGVFIDLADSDGLRVEAEQGLAFGFDGKTLIHPSQVDPINAVFSPGPEEIGDAHQLIAAHAAAVAEGRGVATFRARMIEQLHVDSAQRLLDTAQALSRRRH